MDLSTVPPLFLWFNEKQDAWCVFFVCAYWCSPKQCPIMGGKDMPGMILNNQFRSYYHVLGKKDFCSVDGARL